MVSKHPKPPADLSADSAEWWRECVEQFGLATAGELRTLTEAARSLDRIAQCSEVIQTAGLLVRGARGSVVNPACRLEQQHRQLFLQALRQLGISQPIRE